MAGPWTWSRSDPWLLSSDMAGYCYVLLKHLQRQTATPKYHTVRKRPSQHSWIAQHLSFNSALILFSPAHLRSFMTASNTVVMLSCWQSLPTDRQTDRQTQIDNHNSCSWAGRDDWNWVTMTLNLERETFNHQQWLDNVFFFIHSSTSHSYKVACCIV